MDAVDRVLDALPRRYPGPGGAVAVLRDGEVLARHAWGWANAELRIPFTPRTLFRMCSVTKQFTCAAMLEAVDDPAVLDPLIRARLPLLEQLAPGALALAHNQSGLRDYWAVAMLHGAPAEGVFGEEEAARVIGGARTLQFAPGAAYSYVNQNFRLLGDVVAERTGRSFAELLRGVFARAGMEGAFLAADTRAMPDGTEGYEGSQASGFRAAVNRIVWTGDAGLGASLDDMIAWERHIDATRDDAGSVYRRLSAPVRFADGVAAAYGFGLGRHTVLGRAATGHGGALRGWRSHRVHVASERVSVVVLFNHMADARGAALELLGAALGVVAGVEGDGAAVPAPPWLGAWMDPETRLAVRVEDAGAGRVRVRVGHHPEVLAMQADGSAGDAEGVRLRTEAGGLRMERPGENWFPLLQQAGGEAARDIAGVYRCRELDAALTVADAGGALYGAFSGMLGPGRMELLEPVGADLWALPCPRALDHTPPGDWTLAVRRDGGGAVCGIDVGCWLARGLRYERGASSSAAASRSRAAAAKARML